MRESVSKKKLSVFKFCIWHFTVHNDLLETLQTSCRDYIFLKENNCEYGIDNWEGQAKNPIYQELLKVGILEIRTVFVNNNLDEPRSVIAIHPEKIFNIEVKNRLFFQEWTIHAL